MHRLVVVWGGGGREQTKKARLGEIENMESNTPPLVCQPVETETPPRGLTGRNTKRKLFSKSDKESKSNKVELENLYEKSVLDMLKTDADSRADTRLCSHEKLKDSENYLLCKQCV